jgi:hypothetical protein
MVRNYDFEDDAIQVVEEPIISNFSASNLIISN